MTDEIVSIDHPESALEVVQNTLADFLATADVHAVYDEPIEHGDTLIVPAAEVLCGMGFGIGYGSGSASETEADPTAGPSSGSGGGGGGGGRVFARPVAVIVADAEGVRVEPVIDITKVALASLTAAGFIAGMVMRMLSPKRALPEIDE